MNKANPYIETIKNVNNEILYVGQLVSKIDGTDSKPVVIGSFIDNLDGTFHANVFDPSNITKPFLVENIQYYMKWNDFQSSGISDHRLSINLHESSIMNILSTKYAETDFNKMFGVLSSREYEIILATLQWTGSHVGQCLLRDAKELHDAIYTHQMDIHHLYNKDKK